MHPWHTGRDIFCSGSAPDLAVSLTIQAMHGPGELSSPFQRPSDQFCFVRRPTWLSAHLCVAIAGFRDNAITMPDLGCRYRRSYA